MMKFKSIWGILPLTVWALTLGACSDDDTPEGSDDVQKVENTGLIEAVIDKVPGIGLTTNEDGTVSLTEENLKKMAAVTELDLSECGLTDLSGIEYFTGLVTLDCSGNKLTSLDFGASSAAGTKAAGSAGLTALTELDCSENQLTTLNVDGLTALEDLDCGQNSLTSLTVAGLPKLSRLDCADNLLASVSVSDLPVQEIHITVVQRQIHIPGNCIEIRIHLQRSILIVKVIYTVLHSPLQPGLRRGQDLPVA